MAIKINGDNLNSAVGLSGGDDDSGIKPGTNKVEIVTGGSTRVEVDSSGRALIGANEAVTANFGSAKLQVNNDGDRIASFMYAKDDGSGPHVNLVKSRGGTTDLSSRAVVTNNDELGRLNFIGDDGIDLGCDGAAIIAKIDGSPSSNNLPTELNFHVNSGVQFAEERMRLTKTGSLEVYKGTGNTGQVAGQEAFRVGNGAGNFRFSVYADGTTTIGGQGNITTNNIQLTNDGKIKLAAGGGIDFSPQGASNVNLLDDYEEGSWTPVPRFGGGSHALNGNFVGNYTKIGNTVELRFKLTFSAKGTATGAFTVEGVPFAAVDSFLWCNSGFGFLHRTNLPQTAGQVTADINGQVINFRLLGQNGGNTTAMDNADLVDTSDFRGSITYRVAT